MNDAPPPDVIEVSVFSRGHGEAIAIHVGHGRWVLVDTFLDDGGRSVLMSYLSSCRIDVGVAVEVILFTHWHADHVGGATQVVQACANALVALPGVLLDPEFRALLPELDRSRGRLSRPLQDFLQTLRLLIEQRRDLRFCSVGKDIRGVRSPVRYTFDALSPTDNDQLRMVQDLRAWLIEDRHLRERPDRNSTSVASVLTVAGETVLLGADLEVDLPTSGWQAVHERAWHDRAPATVFKIPHHGSDNAHYPPLWKAMLVAGAHAILTPWSLGRRLPTDADVRRIVAATGNAYAASVPRPRGGRRRARAVKAEMRSLGYPLERPRDRVGQVRLRKAPGDPWRVDLFGDACKLADLLVGSDEATR